VGELRGPVRARALELVAELPSDQYLYWRQVYAAQRRPCDPPDFAMERRCTQPLRDSECAWPPYTARHEGIIGDALRLPSGLGISHPFEDGDLADLGTRHGGALPRTKRTD
jgi:hypothetical protein